MKLRLIDYKENITKERTGTCELCFGTTLCNNPVFTFQKENKEIVKIDGYRWDWGDYTEVDTIDNVIDFAEYICDINFKEEEDLFSFRWLKNLISEYNSEREKQND